MVRRQDGREHGGDDRSPFPQRPRRGGHRDRRPGIHVRGRHAAVRPPACLLRHGRRCRVHLPVLLDAVPPRPDARGRRRAAGRMRLARYRASEAAARRACPDVPAHDHRCRSRHRRSDRGAGARAQRLSRRRAGTGRAARGNRRRHPALAQCRAHSDRSRPRRAGCGLPPSRRRRCASSMA